MWILLTINIWLQAKGQRQILTSVQSATRAPTNRATVTTTMSAPKIIFVEKTIVGITEARPLQILIAAFQVDFLAK